MSKMTAAQKTMMRDFNNKFFLLQEKHWNPADSDEYWDELTADAMSLLEQFHSSDVSVNNFLSATVAVFLNSREAMIV